MQRAPALRIASFVIGLSLALAGAAAAQVFEGTLGEGSDQLENGEYYDGIEIEAAEGDNIHVDVHSDDFQPYIILVAPDGSQLEVTDEDGEPTGFAGDSGLGETGTWTIIVTTQEPGQGGDYTLTVSIENAGEAVEVEDPSGR